MAAKPHIFLFHGEDSYTIQKKINIWVSEFTKKYGHANITTLQAFSGNEMGQIEQLKQLLRTRTLFGGTSLILLRGLIGNAKKAEAEELRNTLILLLPEIPPTTFLVIQEDSIDARTVWYKTMVEQQALGRVHIEMYAAPEGDKLQHWIREQIITQGGAISASGLAQLVKRFTPSAAPAKKSAKSREKEGPAPLSLWGLHHEIEKCVAYAKGREITREDIMELIPEETTAQFFDFVDAVMAGQTVYAITLAHLLLDAGSDNEKSNIIKLVAQMHTQLKDFIMVKSLQDAGTRESAMADELGWPNPNRVWVVSKKLTNKSTHDLMRMAQQLIEFDYQLKTGLQSPVAQFDRLLIELTKKSAS